MNKVRKSLISIRKAAKEIGISEWTLRDRMKRGTPVLKEGSRTSLPEESERELQKKAHWCYAVTRQEVLDLVQWYVMENREKYTELGKYLEQHCKFKASRDIGN